MHKVTQLASNNFQDTLPVCVFTSSLALKVLEAWGFIQVDNYLLNPFLLLLDKGTLKKPVGSQAKTGDSVSILNLLLFPSTAPG